MKIPKEHIGHTIHEDKIARFCGRRDTPGDAWCHECRKPVKLFIKDLPDEIRRPTLHGQSRLGT
jgi:hypothetical protein